MDPEHCRGTASILPPEGIEPNTLTLCGHAGHVQHRKRNGDDKPHDSPDEYAKMKVGPWPVSDGRA